VKAKLGSMATLSGHYSYLAISEMTLALCLITLMACDLRRELNGREFCPRFRACWFGVLSSFTTWSRVDVRSTFRRKYLNNQALKYVCRSRKFGLRPVMQTCLVITELILGSIAEAAVTGLASIGNGAKAGMGQVIKRWSTR